MSELYLIAHKVRGEPAFDVATQMECPICHGTGEFTTGGNFLYCSECDQTGYWWIISTSGHRAFPWWNCPMEALCFFYAGGMNAQLQFPLEHHPMPSDIPDHYPTRATPDAPKLNISALIPPSAPIRRRA